MNYSGYMFIHLLCFVYKHCSVTGFSPTVYNTISSLQKRVPDHPADFKAELPKNSYTAYFVLMKAGHKLQYDYKGCGTGDDLF